MRLNKDRPENFTPRIYFGSILSQGVARGKEQKKFKNQV